MIQWSLVGVIVGSTVMGDLLQTVEMKRVGEVDSFGPGQIGALLATMATRRYLIAAVFLMAVSFFAFMKLLSVADLSFAVPASALSVVLETVIARVYLKEQVDLRRWAGAGLVACGVLLLAL